MVRLARRGVSLREVARRFGVSLGTVQLWVRRAHGQRLDRVCFDDRLAGAPRAANRLAEDLEDLILDLRRQLKTHSALGEHGAAAIRRALQEQGGPQPAVRTIGRVLERRGALDGRRRLRRNPPPRGWYLPELAAGRAELDSFDFIEDLRIAGGPLLDVLTGVSLHGNLADAWVSAQPTTPLVLSCLLARWRRDGLPTYAQFDNDTRFQGGHNRPDVFGRVTRLSLQLGVVPVFAPPREPGFQNAIENFNGRWQQAVWRRFQVASREELQAHAERYTAAFRARYTARQEAAPNRRAFPQPWRLKLEPLPQGRLIFLRRCNAQGRFDMLGHRFVIGRHWGHRLVRAEVDLKAERIRVYGLRRREPTVQPLLQEFHYQPQLRPKFH